MPHGPHPERAILQALQARLHAMQPGTATTVLPFGDPRVDACLPGGGLPLGNLHAVSAHGLEAETGAVTAGFAACLLAALPDRRPLFWIAPCSDLHAPGLSACGLDPGRLILVQTAKDPETLAAMETALRSGAAAAVVGEVGRLGRLAARRLQLACRRQGSTGFVLHRWPYGRRDGVEDGGSVVTRWHIAPAPSLAAFHEPGQPCWRVALEHARGGHEGTWLMEVSGKAPDDDAAHPLRVVAELADTASAPDRRHLAG